MNEITNNNVDALEGGAAFAMINPVSFDSYGATYTENVGSTLFVLDTKERLTEAERFTITSTYDSFTLSEGSFLHQTFASLTNYDFTINS